MNVEITDTNILDITEDKRSHCFSVLTKMPIGEYMKMVSKPFELNGSLMGQRSTLTSTSARKIRERMVEDLKRGAILPPVVIGIVDDTLNGSMSNTDFMMILKKTKEYDISIIDGMQRTTAFKEASYTGEIRVEYWVARKVEDLTYRMLVLNTGQSPWDLKRQIEVVYSSLLHEIEKKLDKSDLEGLYNINKTIEEQANSRTRGGIYAAKDIIEMYLAFHLRSEKVNMQEKLADNFSRIDMIESLSEGHFFDRFLRILICLIRIDINIPENKNMANNGRFTASHKLFSSTPPLVSFVATCSLEIYGYPSTHKADEISENICKEIEEKCNRLVSYMKENITTPENCQNFLAYDILNEKINGLPKQRIGDKEREFFMKAFKGFWSPYFEIPQENLSLKALWTL